MIYLFGDGNNLIPRFILIILKKKFVKIGAVYIKTQCFSISEMILPANSYIAWLIKAPSEVEEKKGNIW